MTRRGSQLAARLRAGIDHKLEEERRREEERQRKLAAAQAVRRELLADLRAFGEAVGHFEISAPQEDGELRLGYRDREMIFSPEGELSDVKVHGSTLGDAAMIQLEPTLKKWVLRWSRRGNRESVLLFDQGLEVLLRTAFEIVPMAEVPVTHASPASDTSPSETPPKRTL